MSPFELYVLNTMVIVTNGRFEFAAKLSNNSRVAIFTNDDFDSLIELMPDRKVADLLRAGAETLNDMVYIKVRLLKTRLNYNDLTS